MADEYIRKVDVKDALQEKVFHNLTDEFYGAMQVLDELPSADVATVVHGKWEYTRHYGARYRKCSVCSAERKDDRSTGWNFCPYCGAKMNGG